MRINMSTQHVHEQFARARRLFSMSIRIVHARKIVLQSFAGISSKMSSRDSCSSYSAYIVIHTILCIK